jgi:hypothetical protein
MSNDFFNASGTPVQGSQLVTPAMRAEFAAIAAGFDKLPTLTGNAYEVVYINASGSAMASVSGDGLLKVSTTGIPSIASAGVDYVVSVEASVTAASAAAIADTDHVPFVQTSVAGALKKITWSSLKTALGSVFAALAGSVSQAFAAASIELGHDTDTTLARVSAGVMSVEGKTVAVLSSAQSFSKAQIGTPVALSVSANAVAVDLSLGNNFTLTLQATTAQTLSNPTNVVAGQKGAIYITQNATPSTLAFASNWIQATTGTAPAVSTTASARNILTYDVFDSTHIYYTLATAGVA